MSETKSIEKENWIVRGFQIAIGIVLAFVAIEFLLVMFTEVRQPTMYEMCIETAKAIGSPLYECNYLLGG